MFWNFWIIKNRFYQGSSLYNFFEKITAIILPNTCWRALLTPLIRYKTIAFKFKFVDLNVHQRNFVNLSGLSKCGLSTKLIKNELHDKSYTFKYSCWVLYKACSGYGKNPENAMSSELNSSSSSGFVVTNLSWNRKTDNKIKTTTILLCLKLVFIPINRVWSLVFTQRSTSGVKKKFFARFQMNHINYAWS